MQKKNIFNKEDLKIISNRGDYTKKQYADARDRIIINYIPIIRARAAFLAWQWPNNADIEELLTVGILTVMNAFENYDPSWVSQVKGREGRKATITTYIYKHIIHRMLTYIQMKTRKKRKYKHMRFLNERVDKSNPNSPEWMEYLDAGDEGMVNIERNDYIREICKHLNEDEVKMLEAFKSTSTDRELSELLGMREERARVRKIKLFEKIRIIITEVVGYE